MDDRLQKAMDECNTFNASEGIAMGRDKKYTQVKDRVTAWRNAFGLDHGMETEVLKDDGISVAVRCIITDKDKRVLSSGTAEEVRGRPENFRGKQHVNETAALENCETSAIGRALAALGLHGGEFASANEMDKVERMAEQQAQEPAAEGHSGSHSNTPAPAPAPVVYKNIEDTMGIRVPDNPWVAQQIAGFVHHRHLGEHNDWKDVNADTLQGLTAADYEQIGKAWQAKKKSLLNE